MSSVRFVRFNDSLSSGDWDRYLGAFTDSRIHQFYGWGESKRLEGWEPWRTALMRADIPCVMAQCLVKKIKLFNFAMIWIPAGPVFQTIAFKENNLENLRRYLDLLIEFLGREFSCYYIRLNLLEAMDQNVVAVLKNTGFRKPLVRLVSGITCVVDLHQDEAKLFANLDAKWRNQWRTSEKYKTTLTKGYDFSVVKRYVAIHNAMCDLKGLSSEKLIDDVLYKQLELLKGRGSIYLLSADGQDGAGCIIWISGKRAFYGLAGTNTFGRQKYFGNSLLWRVFLDLKKQGVEFFDLMGVDPKKNWGVYNFKKGSGGKIVELTGEWEYASLSLLRETVSFLVAVRRYIKDLTFFVSKK